MSTGPAIDYRGARGSNAGDTFHELWALLNFLALLEPDTSLKAVGVEGIRAEDGGTAQATWDGVDCALYYGGISLEAAERLEFAQLKYSAANPELNWTVARLAHSTATNSNNSPIRKLADDFRSAKNAMRSDASLKIRFVSNQGISDTLRSALDARWAGALDLRGIPGQLRVDLETLTKASGIPLDQWQEFVATLDFTECGQNSISTLRQRVAEATIAVLGDDVLLQISDLRTRVRELMLPQRAREIQTEKDILFWFGVGGRDGLFPCPADIRRPQKTIARTSAKTVADKLKSGDRIVLVHGEGGCGKTTLMSQVLDALPLGSKSIIFDCYGGGRYSYSDDRRHLPENAFLQLTNDVAIATKLPLFIPRRNTNPASLGTFLKNLLAGAELIGKITPGALLLVVVDAADNAVTAAQRWTEKSFTDELFTANLSQLPKNVCFVVSCRSGRRRLLALPSNTPDVICPPFEFEETRAFLSASGLHVSEDELNAFHTLSNHNPRVQTYAVAAAAGNPTNLLNALMPGGKSLRDVLRSMFEATLAKIGDKTLFDHIIGALAFLPAPMSISAVATCANSNRETIRDFSLDLSPGLRLEGDALAIADEDFEAFIEEQAEAEKPAHLERIVKHFLAAYKEDEYSSTHIADVLVRVGRVRDLLDIIKADPRAGAISDSVLRRQVQAERLKLSLSACRELGANASVLETILLSAEADRDDATLRRLLTKELDLAVEFGGASLRRLIVLDPERIAKHGAFFAHDAARAARAGDIATAREQLLFGDAWLRKRWMLPEKERSKWTIADGDICARTEAIMTLAGAKAAFADLLRWRPRATAFRVGSELIPNIIAAGKGSELRELLAEGAIPRPWDLVVWVALAMAGEAVSTDSVEASLEKLRKGLVPQRLARRHEGPAKTWFETLLIACELMFALDSAATVLQRAVDLLTNALRVTSETPLFLSDTSRIDGLMRCWLLQQELKGQDSSGEKFSEFAGVAKPQEEVQPPKARSRRTSKSLHSDETRQETRRLLLALFPIYASRMEIIRSIREKRPTPDWPLKGKLAADSRSHELNYGFDASQLRAKAAMSIMELLALGTISAHKLFQDACAMLDGRFASEVDSRKNAFRRLMALRSGEASLLVKDVANTARSLKQAHMPSSDKVDELVQLARLIRPISSEDARALFNDATEIAKEIDLEAFDQIDFLAALAERVGDGNHTRRRAVASNVFTFVSGAARHLADRDDFPWQSAMRALSHTDEAAGAAACARWPDEGLAKLRDTVPALIEVGLRRRSMSAEVATSLALLLQNPPSEILGEILEHSPESILAPIENELARQTLLQSWRHQRISSCEELSELLSTGNSAPALWTRILRETISFSEIDASTEAESTTNNVRPIFLQDKQQDTPFVLETHNNTFLTPEAIVAALAAARKSGQSHWDGNLLKIMRDASAAPRSRASFLRALAGVPRGEVSRSSRLDILCASIEDWKDSPSVQSWCHAELPAFLIENFGDVARGLKERGEDHFTRLLNATSTSAPDRLATVIDGLVQHGSTLGSRDLFALAELFAQQLVGDEILAELEWYAKRLKERLSQKDQIESRLEGLAGSDLERIGRLLFALMSDVDLRIRWRAAHVLRCLARLKCDNVVQATIDQADRLSDSAYRDPRAPFYFLSAKLWLTLSLHRISVETPTALAKRKDSLFAIATSRQLPHVAVREYAKRALLNLQQAQAISLSQSELNQLEQINSAKTEVLREKKGSNRSFGHWSRGDSRFSFDVMDTLPYWYSDILRMFPDVPAEEVLESASRWIIDKWGADADANRWDSEPRRGRLTGHDEQSRTSHRHGEVPTIERYGTHLEWHAMHCVVGELLEHQPLYRPKNDGYQTFEYWQSHFLPTEPKQWLSDLRGPIPLEDSFWFDSKKRDSDWLARTRKDEFLGAIKARPIRGGEWIVLESETTTQFRERVASTSVISALVDQGVAMALVRSLQTAASPYDYRIPYEDDDAEIDHPPFKLAGWIEHQEGDKRFDSLDPLRHGIGRIRSRPGSRLTKFFGLRPDFDLNPHWIGSKAEHPLFVYEAWADEESRDENSHVEARSEGWRLLAKSEGVRDFLKKSNWNLIYEVQLSRRLHKPYGRSYEDKEKRKSHTKILRLTPEGGVSDFQGDFGSWASFGEGAKS